MLPASSPPRAGQPERCDVVKEDGGESAMQFKHAGNPSCAAAGQQSRQQKEQTDGGGGKGPEINQRSEESHGGYEP